LRLPGGRSRWAGGSALAAALLWASAVFPGAGEGRDFWLLDRSSSMGDAEPPAKSSADPDRVFAFAGGFVPGTAGPADRDRTRLGEALRQLGPRLRPGDRLHLWSDGAATDALPPAALLAGVEVDWQAVPRTLTWGELSAPPAVPASGRFEIAVEVLGGDAAVGRLEVAAVAPARMLELVTREAADTRRGVRLVLELALEAADGAALRLRWLQGGERIERSLALASPGRVLAWSRAGLPDLDGLSPVTDPAEADLLFLDGDDPPLRHAALDRGAVVLAEDARLPAPDRSLAPWTAPGGGVVLLLDASGSMDGGPYAAAVDAVAAWSAALPASTPFVVRPFAADLGPALDPRQPEELRRLQERLPFGPTALAEALDEAAADGAWDGVLVLVSDGRAEAPAGGWAATAARLDAAFRAVVCVPVGTEADRSALARLGEIGEAGEAASLGHRLARTLDGLDGERSGPVRAAPDSLWALPARLDPPGARPPRRVAHAAEELYRNADGSAAAALRRQGRGLLVGVAGPPDPRAWAPLGIALVEDLGHPRLDRDGGRVLLRGEAAGWRCVQDGELGFDRAGSGLWSAGPFDPARPVEVRAPDGGSTVLPGIPLSEASADDGAWRAWLAVQRRLAAPVPARPGLLVGALLAALAAVGLGRPVSRLRDS
jgi:hypothetical protein